MTSAVHTTALISKPGRKRSRLAWGLAVVIVLLTATLCASGFVVDLAFWRAGVCLESRNHPRALAWLQSVAWIRPNSAELHFLLARTNRRLERFPEVELHLKRASELGWPRRDLEREQWIAQAQSGQFDAMHDHWADLFQYAGSDGPEISRAYVIAALKRFQIAEAMRVIAIWKADFPTEAEPYFQEGRIAAVALRWKDAEQAYRQALERNPERLDIRQGLIEACLKQLQFANAESELKALLARDPENLDAQVNRADCLMRLGSTDEARQRLQGILRQKPDFLPALILSGQFEAAEERPREAVAAFRLAVAQRPEDAELHYHLGKALRAAGLNEEATTHLRYRELAREPLLRVSQATLELVASPRNQALRYEVGELTWRWKSHAEGATWIMSLLEINPRHQAAHALLARHFELLGNAERAQEHRKQAGTLEFSE